MEHSAAIATFSRLLSQEVEHHPQWADEDVRRRWLSWYGLLLKWNRAYNLTRITEPEEAFYQHLLDSAVALPFVGETGTLVDLGSGAGLPGLLLACLQPKRPVLLVEPVQRKREFLRVAARTLGLQAVKVSAERWPEVNLPDDTCCVVSRATFSDRAVLTPLATRFPEAALILWVGDPPGDPPPGYRHDLTQIELPNLRQARYLMICQPEG